MARGSRWFKLAGFTFRRAAAAGLCRAVPGWYLRRMTDPDLSPFGDDARSAWLRLRTLINLRWLALAGQLAAVLVVTYGLKLQIPLPLCLLVIGASAVMNGYMRHMTAESHRLSEGEATLALAFDLLQLGALLYLTRGLGNPFALLLIAPVTISASVLSLRTTVLLGFAAAAIVTALAVWHLPVRDADGLAIQPPRLLVVGSWASLIIGLVFVAIYARLVTNETFSMSRALAATQMALAREQQMSALGGVVAAAAHELGTPLATIKLVSTELVEELADRPDLQEDVQLISSQAERCRDILFAMGPGKEDLITQRAPVSSVVEEAAAPHSDRGIRVIMRIEGGLLEEGPTSQPELPRRPEIIQGLRNLVQNAVDFARSTVWIDLDWTTTELRVAIGDDGPGYPAELLGRIGQPFIRTRAGDRRKGYRGMGLGLFIAKTLLERTGASLIFLNGSRDPLGATLAGPAEFSRPPGAVVTVRWPRTPERAARSEPEPLAAEAEADPQG